MNSNGWDESNTQHNIGIPSMSGVGEGVNLVAPHQYGKTTWITVPKRLRKKSSDHACRHTNNFQTITGAAPPLPSLKGGGEGEGERGGGDGEDKGVLVLPSCKVKITFIIAHKEMM